VIARGRPRARASRDGFVAGVVTSSIELLWREGLREKKKNHVRLTRMAAVPEAPIIQDILRMLNRMDESFLIEFRDILKEILDT